MQIRTQRRDLFPDPRARTTGAADQEGDGDRVAGMGGGVSTHDAEPSRRSHLVAGRAGGEPVTRRDQRTSPADRPGPGMAAVTAPWQRQRSPEGSSATTAAAILQRALPQTPTRETPEGAAPGCPGTTPSCCWRESNRPYGRRLSTCRASAAERGYGEASCGASSSTCACDAS